MKKGLKMFLLIGTIVIITIIISMFAFFKVRIYLANKKADTIEVSDTIEDSNTPENIVTQINYNDNIGYLTIPDILLENAPIKESTELSTLSDAIGHFTSTSIYEGNVGLASHNSGGKGDYFKNLKNINIGSEIYYQTQYGTKRYIVKTKVDIDETDFSYLQETQNNRITLITCIAGQKEKRLCVQAEEN